ncbi:phosphoadenosine phosphosulfate reductase family protein [Winogradskyella sp.]|uniref:phosphoadenosine phosphosulfate reductase domain-containing protein n=1 Tax=Winogradskyella sp. TaxID=1883156 RepID=UPI003BA8F8FE
MKIDLNKYDLVVVNSSGGKDSVCALYMIVSMAKHQKFPLSRIKVSHQDLGDMEWKGTKELVKKQAAMFGLFVEIEKRIDKNGYAEDLLEYVERRGMWPSRNQRYCTSDFKRAPGDKVIRRLSNKIDAKRVLSVFGFRKEESPQRAKKKRLSLIKRLTTNTREVYECNPILHWTTDRVWSCINNHSLPYHDAYAKGMPRLSCIFCIFSPFDALVVAGKENPELLDRYVEVEKKIGHTFRNEFSISEVKQAIENNYKPKRIANWVM